MSPAVAWVEANAAEGRTPVRIEAPAVHHADLIAAGYAPEAARLDYPGHIVVTDTLGREWAANLPATW
jgi:hypothetical protein